MTNLLKYSKSYQLSLISLITAVIITITLVVIAAVMYQSSEVVMALFFGPALAGVFYMLSIFFWYKGKSRNRFGWARLD